MWGVVDPGKKNRFLKANFRKISILSGNFTKEYRILQANFRKFQFFQAIKKIRFSKQNIYIYSYLWANYSISLQSNHFRTYFLYMIRYNNISRPVHDSNDPLRPFP